MVLGNGRRFIAFYKTKKKILGMEVAFDFYEDVVSKEKKPKGFHLTHKTKRRVLRKRNQMSVSEKKEKKILRNTVRQIILH